MCGRFTLTSTPETLARRFDLQESLDLAPRYNVAPGQDVLAIREESGARRAAPLRWGLVPHWAEDPSVGYRTINARIESVRERPAFRDSLVARRCLVPADGFYEWAERAGAKVPYFIASASRQPFAFAGLWASWPGGDPPLESCTILTTRAHASIRELHDRMPVIVAPDDYADWLDPSRAADAVLLERLRGNADVGAAGLGSYPVASRVNSAAIDDPSCLERVPEPPRQESLF